MVVHQKSNSYSKHQIKQTTFINPFHTHTHTHTHLGVPGHGRHGLILDTLDHHRGHEPQRQLDLVQGSAIRRLGDTIVDLLGLVKSGETRSLQYARAQGGHSGHLSRRVLDKVHVLAFNLHAVNGAGRRVNFNGGQHVGLAQANSALDRAALDIDRVKVVFQ